jgi:hypothetical protein
MKVGHAVSTGGTASLLWKNKGSVIDCVEPSIDGTGNAVNAPGTFFTI